MLLKKYTNDLIVFSDKLKTSWWRKEGHKLHIEDLEKVIEYKPEYLIIGTGNSKKMKVPPKVISFLNKKNVRIFYEKTETAVQKFNQKNKTKDTVVATLHLTC